MGKINEFIYDHFGIGSNPHRLVHCRITTEHGRVLTLDLPAENGYVIDEKSSMAYLLDHAGEVPLRGAKYHELILDERDAYPWMAGQISKSKREEWGKTIDKISANEYSRQFSEAEARVNKNKQNMIILLTFALVAIVLTLMILLMFISTLL